MAFIYSAMDLFVTYFDLSDLVVVFPDSHEGTQIFRWGAKPISPDRNSLITAAPGVYCYPAIDDVEELDLLFARCQQEFDDLRSRGDVSTGAVSPRLLRERPSEAPWRVDEESERRPPAVEVEDRQVEGSRFGVETWRVFASKVFVWVTLANILLALLNVSGGVRFVLGLVLGLAIPGWSIVGLIHFRDTALEIALSMAASIAVVMASAQLMITLHLWHLERSRYFSVWSVCHRSSTKPGRTRLAQGGTDECRLVREYRVP